MPETSTAEPIRRRLRADDRRQQIIEASREVFARSGLAGTRLREIGEAAGVNPALIYQHFESKEALFEAAVAEPLEEAVAELIRRGELQNLSYLASAESRRAKVEELIGELLEAMKWLAPLLGVMLFSDHDRGIAFYRDRFRPAVDAMAAAVSAADPAWDHRDFNPHVVVMSAVGTALLVGLDRNFGGDGLGDGQTIAPELAALLLRGLESPRM